MGTTEYVDRRQQETLDRCTTPAQRERCDQLHAQGKTAYPYARQGKSVIAEFRRYCETFDPEKIGKGLYDWSIMGSGGLDDIAHYDLHGFRATYPHPAYYIEGLLIPEIRRWWPVTDTEVDDPNWFHSQGVYTDGMTKGEVAFRIIEIATEQKERVYADWKAKRDATALGQAQALAESVGMKVVEA